MHPADVTAAAHDIAFSLPTLQLRPPRPRPVEVSPLLATAIPLGIYNFTEGMTQRGERRRRRRQLQPARRSCSPTAPARSSAPRSARRSRPPSTSATPAGRRPAAGPATRWPAASSSRCSASSACSALLGALLPLPGDRAHPALHRPADRRPGVPGGTQAARGRGRRSRSSRTSPPGPRGRSTTRWPRPGTTAAKVGYDNIAANAGAIYKGTVLLGGGAVLAGLLLGAITAFLIDRKFLWAAGYSLAGAVARLHRADPRREGRLGHRRPDRARLPVRRRHLRGRLA